MAAFTPSPPCLDLNHRGPQMAATMRANRTIFTSFYRRLAAPPYLSSYSSISRPLPTYHPTISNAPRFLCSSAPSLTAPLPDLKVTPSEHSRARNADKDAVAVVVGASRGIGLAVVQNLVTRWKGRIIATCRDADSAGALNALWQFMPDRLVVASMDICDEGSIAQVVDDHVKPLDDPRIDFVFHSAGILHEDSHMPETSLSKVDVQFLRRNLDINLVGPILTAKHFSPFMITSRKKDRVPSIFSVLSARVGSISDNRLGGWLSYRASKAGQNQAMKTISIELGRRGIVTASLHPGTVRTDLSAPFQKRVPESQLQDVDVAAERLLSVVDCLQPDDNGGFFAYDGKRIPY